MTPAPRRPSPPRLLRSLLASVVDPQDRASLLNELDDEFDRRVARDGLRPARSWYRRQAMRSLGPSVARRWLDRPTDLPHRSPDDRRTDYMDDLLRDIRHALRSLRNNPAYTFIAVFALALGIGASTAVFSVVDALLISPLPYPDAEQLVVLWETDPTGPEDNTNTPAPGNFHDWKAQSSSFTALAAHAEDNLVLTGVDEPVRLDGHRVTGEFFAALGVGAVEGRVLQPADDRPGEADVVVLSHALWRTRFGSDRGLVGTTVVLGGAPYEVAGVMPADFEYPAAGVDYWRPFAMDAEESRSRRSFYLNVVGRLHDETSPAAAANELDTIAARLEAEYPETNTDHRVRVQPLREAVVGDLDATLRTLIGAIAFVLAIACANVANLALTRAADRSAEVAVRAALGASRARIARQLLVESLLLGVAGGAAGLLVATYGVVLVRGFVPEALPINTQIGLDGRVFAFTAVISIAAAILFGFTPAWRGSRTDLSRALNEGRKGAGVSAATRRIRAALATLEVALAVTLLVGAGLFLQSFLALADEEPGFDPEGALTMRLDFSGQRYADFATRVAFYDELVERVDALPGVHSSALITMLPMTFSGGSTLTTAEGSEANGGEDQVFPLFRVVSPGYTDAMRIPVRGRGITGADRDGAEPVVVVNEAYARHFWPGEEGLGKRIKLGRLESDAAWMTVVGIAADVRQFDMEIASRPEIYVPYTQSGNRGFFMPRDFVVRAPADTGALLGAVRDVVLSIDPDMPLSRVSTLDEVVAGSVAQRRFYALIVGAFAAAALLLAMIGVYGVMSQNVTLRTREIGVRMALGARAADVHAMVIRQGARMIAAGIGLGLLGAVAVSRTLASLLYETAPLDATTFALVCGMVVAVAGLAISVPVRRAVRIDPVQAIVRD